MRNTRGSGIGGAIRGFAGGGLVTAGFGAAVAAICLVVGLLLRGLLEAAAWLTGLPLVP